MCIIGSSTILTVTVTAEVTSINASVVQGSGVGPATYVVTASDLQPLNALNRLVKYAEDTYVIVPACCADSACTAGAQSTWHAG